MIEHLSTFDLVKMVFDVLLLPLFGMTWAIQGRISKLEGQISSMHEIINILFERRSKSRE